jgi:hypothetical protein
MNICFVTEGKINSKIPRNFNNLRTDLAWMVALDAKQISFFNKVEESYDYAFCIMPKNFNHKVYSMEFISWLRTFSNKIIFLQEGPNDFWQNYEIDGSIDFYNLLTEFDAITCHNENDINYYKGLLNNKPVFNIQSLMITDILDNTINEVERKNCIIGGTFCQWYGGFDSFHVARYSGENFIFAPSMGRKSQKEEYAGLVNYLPYLDWYNWILKLNEFKYAVHLMRTFAAGTFALNCAYLGIPCIGYNYVDTQRFLYPVLSVDLSDLKTATELMKRLKEDNDFYNDCSNKAKKNYYELYSEEKFLQKIKKDLSEI